MMNKAQVKPNLSRVESVSDVDPIQFKDAQTYTYIDHKGKKQVQDIREFEHENVEEITQELSIKPNEHEYATKKMVALTNSFRFFRTPDSVLWDEFQTDIKNQSNRNTCTAFTMVAAIEARYMRDYGLKLDLSEQFFWHSYKSTGLSNPKIYNYENQSSMWGGGNIHGIRTAINFAIPLEEDCPYLNQNEMQSIRSQIPEAGQLIWQRDATRNTVSQDELDAFEYSPLYIPYDARHKAKYGAKTYQLLERSQVQNSTVLEFLLAAGNEIMVGASLRWVRDRNTGVLNFSANANAGAHAFLVVGYDRDDQVFFIKNSWGEAGFIRVSYEFAQNCFTSGSMVTSVTDPKNPTQKGRAIGRWQMNHDGWEGELTIRRFTDETNNVTRLGHYRSTDGSLSAINGNSIGDGRGFKFYRTSGPNTATSDTSGQLFTVDQFSKDVTQAAGDTHWRNIPFGVYMNRNEFHTPSGSHYKPDHWVGTWSVNHDGWQGKLTITQVINNAFLGWVAIGHYQLDGDSQKQIVGYLQEKYHHELNFTVPFSSSNRQPFTLIYHTRNSGHASGYTFWNGTRFGAVAIKR